MSIPLVFPDFNFAGFTADRQFHILKHFQSVDSEYKEYLTGHYGCAHEDIEIRLKMHGSKFRNTFCSNPLELIDLLKAEFRRQQVESYWTDDRCEFQISFLLSDFPNGIGEDRVLHINEVPDLIKEPFIGKDIETLHNIIYKTDPRPTWTANVILQLIGGQPEVISIFPGIYAPSFPDREGQEEEQYAKSMQFWCQHIIIA